jgi:anti-sigma B factor antagonist
MNLLMWAVEETDEAVVVRFAGELDMAEAADAEKVVRGAEDLGKPLLVLDLSGLEFVDSTGVHLLLLALERSREGSHRLALVPGGARRLLKLAGVLDRFDLLDKAPTPARD